MLQRQKVRLTNDELECQRIAPHRLENPLQRWLASRQQRPHVLDGCLMAQKSQRVCFAQRFEAIAKNIAFVLQAHAAGDEKFGWPSQRSQQGEQGEVVNGRFQIINHNQARLFFEKLGEGGAFGGAVTQGIGAVGDLCQQKVNERIGI